MPTTAREPQPEVMADALPASAASAPIAQSPNRQTQTIALQTRGVVLPKIETKARPLHRTLERAAWPTWSATYMSLAIYAAGYTVIDTLKIQTADLHGYEASHGYANALGQALANNPWLASVMNFWEAPAIAIVMMFLAAAIYCHSTTKWLYFILGETAEMGLFVTLVMMLTAALWVFTGSWSNTISVAIFLLLGTPLMIVVTLGKGFSLEVWRNWADGKMKSTGGVPQLRQTTVAHSHWTAPENRWFRHITED